MMCNKSDVDKPPAPCLTSTGGLVYLEIKKAPIKGLTILVFLRRRIFQRKTWLRGSDLNRGPSGYEPDELPGCSTPLF